MPLGGTGRNPSGGARSRRITQKGQLLTGPDPGAFQSTHLVSTLQPGGTLYFCLQTLRMIVTETFDAAGAGNWVAPAGILNNAVTVDCRGGGGSGWPGITRGGNSGSGGGTGQDLLTVTPGASYSYIVGGGAVYPALKGVDTTFNATIGRGGNSGSFSSGGAAASGVAATVHMSGSGNSGDPGPGFGGFGTGTGAGGGSAAGTTVGGNHGNAGGDPGFDPTFGLGGTAVDGGGNGGNGGGLHGPQDGQHGQPPGGGGGGGLLLSATAWLEDFLLNIGPVQNGNPTFPAAGVYVAEVGTLSVIGALNLQATVYSSNTASAYFDPGQTQAAMTFAVEVKADTTIAIVLRYDPVGGNGVMVSISSAGLVEIQQIDAGIASTITSGSIVGFSASLTYIFAVVDSGDGISVDAAVGSMPHLFGGTSSYNTNTKIQIRFTRDSGVNDNSFVEFINVLKPLASTNQGKGADGEITLTYTMQDVFQTQWAGLTINNLPPLAQSVSNVDGSLTIAPTTGNVIATLNTGHANEWTAQQTFTALALNLVDDQTFAFTLVAAVP